MRESEGEKRKEGKEEKERKRKKKRRWVFFKKRPASHPSEGRTETTIDLKKNIYIYIYMSVCKGQGRLGSRVGYLIL